MNIVITGRHIDVSPELTGFIREKIERLDRLVDRLHGATIVIDTKGEGTSVEFVVGGSRGVRFAARAVSTSVHDAVRIVESRIERQLLRFKGKLQGRRQRAADLPLDRTVVPEDEYDA